MTAQEITDACDRIAKAVVEDLTKPREGIGPQDRDVFIARLQDIYGGYDQQVKRLSAVVLLALAFKV